MTPTDLAIDRFPAACSAERLLKTPDEETHLALRPDAAKGWTNPGFGTLYLLTNEANDLVRVGRADRLRKRFTAMNVDSPVNLAIAHFVHVVDPMVARGVEEHLQTRLLPWRIRGEWFGVTVDTAAQALAEIVTRRHLRFWSEAERREVGKLAARIALQRP